MNPGRMAMRKRIRLVTAARAVAMVGLRQRRAFIKEPIDKAGGDQQ